MSIKMVQKAFLLSTSLLLLSGCSVFEREDVSDTRNKEIVVISDYRDIHEETFYIFDGKTNYTLPYNPAANFDASRSGASMNGSTDKVIFITDDYDSIPVMTKNDKIVYNSPYSIVDSITIERFYDAGYSFGIAGLKKDNSGRYRIAVGEDVYGINRFSDAYSLNEIYAPSGELIIESIGRTPLRSGNVSAHGTVIGLEQNNTYAVNAYNGTNINKVNLVADTRIFTSSEGDTITGYEFMEGTTIEFSFPEYYNSGYYMIGNQGLVKYIAEEEYDKEAEIDMNIPNVYPTSTSSTDEESNEAKQINNTNDTTNISITINDDGEYEISLNYKEEQGKSAKAPTARLISEEEATPFESSGDSTLKLKATLSAGKYTIQISNLNGRKYSYRVDSTEEPETNKEETEQVEEVSESKSIADIINSN